MVIVGTIVNVCDVVAFAASAIVLPSRFVTLERAVPVAVNAGNSSFR